MLVIPAFSGDHEHFQHKDARGLTGRPEGRSARGIQPAVAGQRLPRLPSGRLVTLSELLQKGRDCATKIGGGYGREHRFRKLHVWRGYLADCGKTR